MNAQNQARLTRYFNTGQMTRADLIRSLIAPSLPFRINAREAKRLHSLKPAGKGTIPTEIRVPVYQGSHPAVLQMMSVLKDTLSGDLAGAYLHGSLSTGDSVGYSDFDGLVIIKDEVFESPERTARVALEISRSFSVMVHFDPLQHHGWFILTEKDLSNFPTAYFPPVLFSYASSLLNHGTDLTIKVAEQHSGYTNQLKRVAHSVISKLDRGKGLKNMFVLKALLSEFMLMPSLFIESKTGEGVYKKYSFELARPHFSAADYSIMDEVSEIRQNWHYNATWTISPPPVIMTPWLRKQQAARSGPVPVEILQKMNPAFLDRMRNLASLFMQKSS